MLGGSPSAPVSLGEPSLRSRVPWGVSSCLGSAKGLASTAPLAGSRFARSESNGFPHPRRRKGARRSRLSERLPPGVSVWSTAAVALGPALLTDHCDGNRRVCEEVLCERQGGPRAAFDRQ